jgi:two-component system, LytTR family, response regulator
MSNYLTAIIIDDEIDGRLLLSSMLTENCPAVRILGTFDTAVDGLLAIQKLKPELVFLDIEMPKMNAFAMLEKIGTIDFEIIFVTAYDQYAIKAIKVNAMEYILKPLDKDDLLKAVDKCLVKAQTSKQNQLNTSIGATGAKMAIPTRDGFLFVDQNRIIRCEGDGNYTNIYLENDQKYLSSKTLKDFEEILPSNFVRIHKSHLVNTQYIKKYIKGNGGTIVMNDDTELEVSRRNKELLLNFFNI